MDATRPAPPARRTDESTATEAQDAGAPTAPTAAADGRAATGAATGTEAGSTPATTGSDRPARRASGPGYVPPPAPPPGLILRLTVAMCAAAALFLAVPEIDLWVSGLFHTPGENFWFRTAPLGVAYDAWRDLLLIVPLLVFLVWQIVRGRRSVAEFIGRAREVLFVAVATVISNGLVVNAVFKENWGRARPHQTEVFGGTKEFSPPLVPAGQCDSNCSFVGGDMGFAFGMIALAFLAHTHRRMWVWLVMAYAVVISLFRIAPGAHFLSDGIFAGLITTIIVVALFHLFLGESPRDRRLREVTGLASLGAWAVRRIEAIAAHLSPIRRRG